MPPSRRRLLAGLLVAFAVLTAALMWRILPTVFFAVTIAYVLVPVATWVRRRGYSRWTASAVATAVALVAVLALFVPIVALVYFRRKQVLSAIESMPSVIVVEFGNVVYPVETSEVTAMVTAALQEFAIGFARATPVIAAKALVFGFVVFALVVRRGEVKDALLAPLPARYHDIAFTYNERFEEVLRALYVTQAVTGFATFLIAIPVFWGLGYHYPVALAVVAGILQFLPVIGPSVVVIAVAAGEVVVGSYVQAALVLVFGLVLVGFLPDAILRPRLARRTAHMPASLYFVGFTGGVLSLGFVGIIAGPLVVALLVETLELLAEEMTHDEYLGPDG